MYPILLRLKKVVTYSVIFSYFFHILAPTAQAMMADGDERQRFQTGLLKKVRGDVSLAKSEADRILPTLRIDLTKKGETEIFKLKIKETKLDLKTEKPLVNFKWKHEGNLKTFATLGSGILDHPWKESLELKLSSGLLWPSKLEVTCRPQFEDGREFFTPYNYVFNCGTDLTLNHLITPGYIDVGGSEVLRTIFVEGQAGIRLKSQKGIQNYLYNLKPAQIRSKGQILLEAPQLDNRQSIISGKKIFGYFEHRNQEKRLKGCSGAVENSKGQICAEGTVHLYGSSTLNNTFGRIESKSDQVQLSTDKSFKQFQGIVKSYLDLELYAMGSIENRSGLIESRGERVCISTGESFDNFFGALKSFRELELHVKGKLNNWKGFMDSKWEKLTLNTGETSNIHGGQITCQGLLSLQSSGDIDNFNGFIESRAHQVQLTSNGSLLNQYDGQVRGKKGLDLKVKGDLKNHYANLWSEGEITLEANNVEHRGFDALIDGKNVFITAKKNLRIGLETFLKTQRAARLTASTIVLRSPLLSRYVFLKASEGLTFDGPQCVEYLDIDLQDYPFLYKEDQLQALRRLSINKYHGLTLDVPLKIKGALEITAREIDIKTTLAAEGQITLTGNSKWSTFPVTNGGAITSNTKGITINGQGFCHRGDLACAGNFKFGGPNIQLLRRINVGGDAHFIVPDQEKIERKNCALGNQSYINYSCLESVDGLLHLTLPANCTTFPQNFKTAGRLLLDRAKAWGYKFDVYYDLIAKKGVKIDMPDAAVQIGLKSCGPIKIQSKEGDFEVNARSLDIVKAEIYAKRGINFTVKKEKLHIGRSVETNVPMISRTEQWDYFKFRPCLTNFNFPFSISNGTFITSEGDVTFTSPEGVLVDGAEITLHRNGNKEGNWTIFTSEPVRNEGGKINIAGNLCIVDIINKSNDTNTNNKKIIDKATINNNSNSIFQNCMATKTSPQQFHGGYPKLNPGNGNSTLTHPYSSPGEITIGGDLIVKAFENFGSKAYIQGKLTHPLSSRNAKFTQEDFFASASIPGLSTDFWFFCEGGQRPVYKLLAPLQRRIESNVTFGKPVTLDYSGPKRHVIESAVHGPEFKVVIKDGTLQIGAIANYQRPEIPKFQQAKMFIDEYREPAFFKPNYHSKKQWIFQPKVSLSFKMNLPPHVVFTPTGARLADPAHDQFLFHPLMNIDALSRVFNVQLGRACLDWDNTDNRKTYEMGHQSMYEFFQKYPAPLGLQNEPCNRNSASSTALVQNQSKSLTNFIKTLSQKEQDKYKFMIFYYESEYEDGPIKRDVLMPVSWVSSVYDNPILRSSDVIGTDKLYIFGKSQGATLLNYGHLHGEEVNQIEVQKAKNIRTSYTWTEYRVNHHHRSGGWFSSSKDTYERVAIPCSRAQPTTGNITTGQNGKLTLEAAELDHENGASIQSGEGGQKLLIGKFNATPAINTHPVTFNYSAKKCHGEAHGVGAELLPAQVTSTGGMDWDVKEYNFIGTHIIDQKKDINMVVGVGHLLPARQTVLANVTAEGNSKTTTVQTTYAQIGLSTVIAALKGDVRIQVKTSINGLAPVIFGKRVKIKGKFDLPGTFLRHSVHTESENRSTFSSSTTIAVQHVLGPFPTEIEGTESITFEGDANLPGAHLKAPIIEDNTENGLKLPPVIARAHHRQETTYSSPLANGKAGSEGWREIQIRPQIDAKRVIRTNLKGHMLFINAILNIDEIQGKHKKKVRILQDWHRSWSEHRQFIPQPVVIAISMIAAYYTGGLLGPALQGLGAAGAMLSAGLKAMVSMATNSMLQNGDPQKAIEKLLSGDGLKAIGESMATAGVLDKLAPKINVNMASGQQGIANNLPKAALSNAVKAAVKTAMGESATKALLHGVKQTAVDAAAATAATHIGTNVKNPVMHKVAQGGAAAALDMAAGGNRKSAASAGGAAMGAAMMAEAFIDPEKLMQEVKAEGHPEQDHKRVFEKKRDDLMAWIGAVTVGLTTAFGGDQASATFAGDNVLHNDVAPRKAMPQKPVVEDETNSVPPLKKKKIQKTLKTTAEKKKEEGRQKAPAAETPRKKKEEIRKIWEEGAQKDIQEALQPTPQKDGQEIFNLIQEVVHEEQRGNKGLVQRKTTPHKTIATKAVSSKTTSKEGAPDTLWNIYASPDGFQPLSPLNMLPLKEKAQHLWNLFVEDSRESLRGQAQESRDYFRKQANRDILQEIANLPIPGAGIAAVAYEGREIYDGNQNVGSAVFNIVFDIVAGKLVISAVKKVVVGGKSVFKFAKANLPTKGVIRSPQQIAKHNNPTPWKEFDRDIYKEDLGKNIGGIKFFSAELSMKSRDVVNIHVEWLEGKGVKLRNLRDDLVRVGKETGANVLEITAQFDNDFPGAPKSIKLKNHLVKNHNWIPTDRPESLVSFLPIDLLDPKLNKNWYKTTIPLVSGKDSYYRHSGEFQNKLDKLSWNLGLIPLLAVPPLLLRTDELAQPLTNIQLGSKGSPCELPSRTLPPTLDAKDLIDISENIGSISTR